MTDQASKPDPLFDPTPPETIEPLDLIWGVEGIGKLIGRTYQQTYHMIRSGQLPMVKQVGERYVVSRSKIAAFFLGDGP